MKSKVTNKQKVKFIFDTLEQTGTTITDFATITCVSRNALHKWKRGGNIVDKLRLDIAYTQAQKLKKMRGYSREQIIHAMKMPWAI